MYRTSKVAVVVPAFNEQAHIAATLAGIPAFVDIVYVVDDASTDRTADIVRAFIARSSASPLPHFGTHALTHSSEAGPLPHSPTHAPTHSHAAGSPPHSPTHALPHLRTSVVGPRIELVQHARNSGVGAAIITGYKRALADGADIAVVMAGDNQMDPVELPRLLAPIIGGLADYTKGDRTSRREHLAGMPPWRRLGNWLLRWLTRIATGNMNVNDPQNGYTAASRDLLTALPLDDLYPRYGYCNQLLCWVSLHRKRLIEVPMPARYMSEESKIRYHTYIPKLLWLLMRLTAARLAQHPTTDSMRMTTAERMTRWSGGMPEYIPNPAPAVVRQSSSSQGRFGVENESSVRYRSSGARSPVQARDRRSRRERAQSTRHSQ